jgi:hypothetical protein
MLGRQPYLATDIPIIRFPGIEPVKDIFEQVQIFPDDSVRSKLQDGKFVSWVVQLGRKI